MKNIIINSMPVPFEKEEISYQELVEKTGRAYNEEMVYTVTYYKGVDGAQGSLIKGQSVAVADGMIFNVTVTNNA